MLIVMVIKTSLVSPRKVTKLKECSHEKQMCVSEWDFVEFNEREGNYTLKLYPLSCVKCMVIRLMSFHIQYVGVTCSTLVLVYTCRLMYFNKVQSVCKLKRILHKL